MNTKMKKDMRRRVLLFFLVFVGFLSAQNYETDALRFSINNYSGSARFVASGGAFSSVGADISNLSYNPAGIGMYRSSVIQTSLGINYAKSNSEYLNQSSTDLRVNPLISNFGAVFANTNGSKNGMFRGFALGVAFNRLSDFNSNQTIKGFNTNPGSSITWNWNNEISAINGSSDGSVGTDVFSFEAVNAYYGYLVNFDSSLLDYTSPVVDSINQTRFSEIKGGKNELVVSGGANYADKLFFGLSIGIPFVNYQNETRFIEEDAANSNINTFFNDFEMKQEYETEGMGFNLKLGVLYRVNDWFRLGGGFQTPERISFTETYSASLETNMDFATETYEPLLGEFDYRLRLPWRANVGASFFIKKHGFIAVDYEAVGYNSTKYTFGTDFKELSDAINADIKAKYQVGHNVRVGFEAVIKKLRLRGGYNYIGSPIRTTYSVENYDFTRHVFSGGFGFIVNRFAIDFAYQHNLSKEFEQPYTVGNTFVSGVNKQINQGTAIVSFAYKIK